VAAGMLAALFGTFLLQIFTRYVISAPLGWTVELSLTLWLWLIFWGSAVVLDEREHVRFDIVYHWVGARTRRIFALVSAIALFAGFAASYPATLDYITFYRIKSSATLGIRLDVVFSVYGLFAAAMIIRQGWRVWRLARGGNPDDQHPEVPSS
jgi:TRAP-type C4-dicarboxylate transport system permease small subunit